MGNPYREFYKAVQEERQCKKKLADVTNECNQAYAKKRDKGIIYYNEFRRKEIYDRAKAFGFSAQDLEKMAYYLGPDHWNQDEICRSVGDQIVDAVDLFLKAEQFLNDNVQKKRMRDVFFDTVSALGNHVSKEEDINDN